MINRLDDARDQDGRSGDRYCSVDGLSVDYKQRRAFGRTSRVRVVDNVSFFVRKGETLGIVGESGCGKTTVARAIVRLLEPAAGSIILAGTDLARLKGRTLQRARREFQMIFQDSMATLDTHMTVAEIVMEPAVVHGSSRRDARASAQRVLSAVGLDATASASRPIELSGGQRQRAAIARALILRPGLIVCDEPTSALDVSVQAQVLNLLTDLQDEYHLTYIFISHDLSVVRHLASSIVVMYMGKIVEVTTSAALIDNPAHPYTRALLSVVPTIDSSPRTIADSAPLGGELPAIGQPPSGCRFRTRCPFATDICASDEPRIERVAPNQQVACHHWRTLPRWPGLPTDETTWGIEQEGIQ